MKFQKFHFMNGTMCATSSKKKMTAILLGLTLALAPYGMTSAEAAAKSGTEAAPAVTAVVPPTDAVAAKDAVNAGEEAKAVKDAGLRLDLEAPSEKYPSMTGALQHYLLEKQG